MNKLKELRDRIAASGREREKANETVVALQAKGESIVDAVAAWQALGEQKRKLEAEADALEKFESDVRAEALAAATREPARVEDNATKRPFHSLGEFLGAVVRAENPRFERDPRLHALASGANVGLPADGGYAVGEQFEAEILKRVNEAAQIAPRCREIPISGNANRYARPYVDETSRATGSRNGGVRVYRAAEAASVTATKPTLGKLEIALEKLVGLAYLTDELLEDAAQMTDLMTAAFAEEMAWVLDDEILNGNGVGKCLGIKTSAAHVSVAKETSQAAATVVGANIDKMYARLWVRSRGNAVWFVNQDVEPQLHALARPIKNVAGSENVGGSVDGPLYNPPGSVSNPGAFGLLKGRPVIPIEQCATLGTKGDIVLADMSQYLLIIKGGIKSDTSMHVKFVENEQAIRWVRRANGAPSWKTALTPANGANTVSPFIFLDTRA